MEETINSDQLVARTMRLLSRAATVGVCRNRVRAVIQHLDLLSEDLTLHASIREVSGLLAAEWRQAENEEFGDTSMPVSH